MTSTNPFNAGTKRSSHVTVPSVPIAAYESHSSDVTVRLLNLIAALQHTVASTFAGSKHAEVYTKMFKWCSQDNAVTDCTFQSISTCRASVSDAARVLDPMDVTISEFVATKADIFATADLIRALTTDGTPDGAPSPIIVRTSNLPSPGAPRTTTPTAATTASIGGAAAASLAAPAAPAATESEDCCAGDADDRAHADDDDADAGSEDDRPRHGAQEGVVFNADDDDANVTEDAAEEGGVEDVNE